MAKTEHLSDKFILPEDFQSLSETEKTMEFFRALGYKDKDRLYMRRFHDKDKEHHPSENMECDLSQFPSFRSSMIQYNKDGYGFFYVVNGCSQRDSGVKDVRAQFMEMDDYSFEDQVHKINAFPLEPSIIVKTRKSLHVYWLIRNGDIKQFRSIQKMLSVFFDGDRSIHNESRTMRIPYFYHMKQEPIMVEIVHFKPENVYSQQDLIEVLPEVPEGNVSASKTIGRNEKYDLPEVIEEGRREHELFCYACSLQAKGYPDHEISDLVHEANRTRCTSPLAETEINQSVLSALKRYQKGNALKRFHKYNVKGIPYDINDEEILRYILAHENLMVLDGRLFLYENGVYLPDEDGLKIRAKIKKLMYQEVIKNGRIKQALDLIMAEPSLSRSMEDPESVNCHPKHWINFKNGMFDVKDMTMHDHDPKHYSINQIPHDFNPDREVPEESTVRRFLEIKFPDPDDRKMFLQFCGYCMTVETTWQKFLILFGKGDVGKSTILRLMYQAIGNRNISSVPLQKLEARFYPAKLCGMLLNACADIPSEKMDQVGAIKQMTGEDMIMGEYKGGKVFFFKSYAKLIFSANTIPPTYEDETGAFYRRLLLIQILERGEYLPDLEAELSKDVASFLILCVEALHDALQNGFTESENSKKHVNDLRKSTDSVWGFLEEKTCRDPKEKIRRTDLYNAYTDYCKENGWQEKTAHRFYDNLVRKGFNPEVIINGFKYVKGLTLKSSDFHTPDQEDPIPFE